MRHFRLRLILALIAGITVVSLASTYFEVLARKHVLRRELERRTGWLGTNLQPFIEEALTTGATPQITAVSQELRSHEEALGLAVFDGKGSLMVYDGPAAVLKSLPPNPVRLAIKNGVNSSLFGHTQNQNWLEEAVPLHVRGQQAGALVVLEDAGYIRSEAAEVWRQTFWRIVASVVLIVGVTVLMVRWFLMRPITRIAERLRRLRMGSPEHGFIDEGEDLSLFTPIAREVENITESLMEARAAAAAEARLRDAGEHLWTAGRLTVHVRQHAGDGRIFVVSNREPYMHVRQGKETVCTVPPSGLVTAIEPVLRACDGVWVALGSGSEDRFTVDENDRLRVPPDDPRYTLRRVWLSPEEEAAYYDGFANEGLWPLCHIAHTRPIFRASDWECYQAVNRKFAQALLHEMEDCADPIVFVQDYHFALLPRMIKAVRPDARVAIFWHIPWPNPEAFGICPWQAELLEGLLGADLIGFHISLHCNNFMDTVDRVLESRTDREHMTARRRGHTTTIRPYPVSVAIDPGGAERAAWGKTGDELLREHGVRGEKVVLGVDRLDYTKGIVERLTAFERMLEEHPWHRERVTMVQIAAPSRTRIPSYAELRRRVEAMVEQINTRFQTGEWRPVLLIERQCSHEEVTTWYRAADVCLVTSLHDGMNLVAKEYMAARDDEDGVLVLSKFTGAAVELRDALIVNPYDIDGVADAIHRGLEMNASERRMRMQRMRRQIMEHNVYRWAASILGDLCELRIENLDSGRQEPLLVQRAEGPQLKRA
ncbi:MAG TPA: trehalose-6-phosphate synthase [Terracidiphilus sp.]|jgi:trehalose 6-phosphate synthase|nr:trehalose-6-phosphate synthase [Terracidiphilus sp.]